MDHKGNIVITGTSSGIGKALAEKFTREGYRVFGSVRKFQDAEDLKRELGSLYVPLVFDVIDEEAVRSAITKVKNQLTNEGIDLLINNAGISIPGACAMMSTDDFRQQFEVNLFGLISVTNAVLPLLGAERNYPYPRGKIINIGSVSGQLSYPFMAPYCASKAALEGYSHSLRRELLIYGIDVIIIGPGPIKTPIWDKVPEIEDEYGETDYKKAMINFKDIMLKEGANGMEAAKCASTIYKIFTKKKPKTRYAILKNKLTGWTIPRYLIPDRMMDRVVRKMLKL